MKAFFKGFFKVIGILLLVIVLLAGGLVGYLTVTEYRPADTERVYAESLSGTAEGFRGGSFTVLGWNIGYGSLGRESEFFMDGGSEVRPPEAGRVDKNISGIYDTIRELDADFCLLQEVDAGSARSYNRDETQILGTLPDYAFSTFAYNYKCDFVPFPVPPLGRVQSGLYTLSSCFVGESSRVSLPCPFSWPMRAANLKRCLLVTRVPIEGMDKELVLVNLHLEAYDDGEGRIAQTRQLLEFLDEEYAKGNYIVAGGDWNQVFPGTLETYPNAHPELWTPGTLELADFPEDWTLCWDDTTPTCRLLNQPYDPADTANTQYYVIDGFLISPNLELMQVQTVDKEFACSDHNPVLLELRFAE